MRRCLIAAACLLAQAAAAQNFVTETDTSAVRAVPVAEPAPAYPSGVSRSGAEGWVRLHFVVAADGQAVDPIVVDSVGGEAFERSALDTLAQWRFEPAADGSEIGNNVVDMRFEIRVGRDLATSNFMRRYRRIVTHLHHEETETAREQVDQAVALGGWNLYEATMLNLMLGRVEAQEGDLNGKLEFYRRALGVGDRAALNGEDRRDVIKRIFEAEFATGQYGSAQATAAMLSGQPNSEADYAALADDLATIDAALSGDDDLVVTGALSNACDCDTSEPVWHYRPARAAFRLRSTTGELTRYETRCDALRDSGAVETGRTISLPDGDANCRVFLFGAEGTTFELVEPGSGSPDDEPRARQAVALR